MNLVRLGLILSMSMIAYYAMTIYAALPAVEPVIKKVETTCTYAGTADGAGAILIAAIALTGAIGTAAVDLWRRVY